MSRIKMSLREIRKMVEEAEAWARTGADALETQKNNPTVRDMYYQYIGEQEMAAAILYALRGDRVQLRLRSSKD